MAATFMLLIDVMQCQIDGNIVRTKFTLPERKKVSPPPKVVPTASKREAPKIDNVGADVEKDGPKRQREHKPFVGASVGYFSFLFLLPGRALTAALKGAKQTKDEVDNEFASLQSELKSGAQRFPLNFILLISKTGKIKLYGTIPLLKSDNAAESYETAGPSLAPCQLRLGSAMASIEVLEAHTGSEHLPFFVENPQLV
ncbi:Calpain-type cysteine protease dek1 [Sarracenia purpurea var. burkii]